MSARALTLEPAAFGLPGPAEFKALRIWDSYYLPRPSGRPGGLIEGIAADRADLAPFQIERLCALLHIGLGTLRASGLPSPDEDREQILQLLEREDRRVLGIIYLNANDVAGSLAALDRWVRNGPAIGVYFKSSQPGCLACTHPNFDPLVERCGELGALIMQHTWFKAGGKADPGESTPAELATLARRHPDVTFVCAHAGGDWERGICAVRDCGNVLVETSGFDPTAGFIDMAVRELGAPRVVFGGHFMSRSVGTEFGKILEAAISNQERELIFGGNLRRLLRGILPSIP